MKVHKDGLMFRFLNDKTKEQAAGNNPEGNVTWVDARDIERNENNFYGIRDVEKLANMMAATTNYIEPLIVTPIDGEDGKYRLIAGERRRAAVMLRFENGDIADPKVPCVIKHFEAVGNLTESDMEMLCLIVSNRGQRQTRTVYEKLREIQCLEPIARKIYEDEKVDGTFRRFFAEEILMISGTQLQRLKTLVKLVPEGTQAIEDGKLSETAAMEVAAYNPEEQRQYIEALYANEVDGRIASIQQWFNPLLGVKATNADVNADSTEISDVTPLENDGQDEAVDTDTSENDGKAIPAELMESASASVSSTSGGGTSNTYKPKRPLPKSIINIDTPFPEDLSGDKAEREADNWITAILVDSIKFAEAKMNEAREEGHTKEAALWDSRRARAVLVLQTVQD